MTQVTRSIKLEPENWQALMELATLQGVTVNAMVSAILKDYARENGKRWEASGQWGGKRVKRVDIH